MSIENIRRIKELARMPKAPKMRKPIAKKSAKKIAQEADEKAQRVGGGNELDRWFKERRKEMTAICAHCGKKTEKNSDSLYKNSIAHLLPKRLFKSIATHPDNWLELCYYENSCHTNYDNHMLDLIDLNCFDEAIRKFASMYPHIAPKERKYIPDILLQYVETER